MEVNAFEQYKIIFQKQYWTKNDVMPQGFQDEDEEEPIAQDQKKFFEEQPKNSDVGIKIENVSKVSPVCATMWFVYNNKN
ncbi:ATP-binding cassette sub-family A member 3 [Operophtera brumata]|uniref:ATP-binding cassette sub-family A member 3 n=1 Tax=Operophtera brumata TaxID=104452 RepID=A0A0L7KUC7_OPEBR|nr:ATP-binding cassette sub-family A member 3 [Operophtera brumata]